MSFFLNKLNDGNDGKTKIDDEKKMEYETKGTNALFYFYLRNKVRSHVAFGLRKRRRKKKNEQIIIRRY